MLTALRILAAADRPLRDPTPEEARESRLADWWWFGSSYCTPTATYYSQGPRYLM